jgi:hypothetical protein
LNTNVLDLDSKALFIENHGFSVVAPIKVMIPFSTKGNNVSCCALFRLCISSKKTIDPFAKLKFISACFMISFKSSFLLETPDNSRNCASILFAIILANVVFPVPAGHQKSIDGMYLLSKKLDIGTIISFCHVKSSIFCGLSRLDSGSSIVFDL